jgi:hypothetical protein
MRKKGNLDALVLLLVLLLVLILLVLLGLFAYSLAVPFRFSV